MRLITITVLLLSACSEDVKEMNSAASDASWEVLSEDDLSADSDEKDDTGKSEGDACGDEVVEGEACEGHWSETMCVDEAGEWWWCEESVWTSDKDE